LGEGDPRIRPEEADSVRRGGKETGALIEKEFDRTRKEMKAWCGTGFSVGESPPNGEGGQRGGKEGVVRSGLN